MNRPPEEILIVGSGAMASLFAARLASAGVWVTILGSWPVGLDALETQGVQLEEGRDRYRSFPVRVARDADDCRGTYLAIVLVKSWQTGRTARQLATCLEPEGLALTLQNGLNNDRILAEALGWERVALGVTTSGATLLAPGRVRPVGSGTISLGDHLRLRPIATLLEQAGFSVEVVANPASLVWGKLAINSAINPLTAILQVSNGQLLERPVWRTLLSRTAEETAAVAAALGIPLPYTDPTAAVEKVARLTAGNTSSMLSDILRGSPTEIEAINGAVVEAGIKVGVATPLNQSLWQLVNALEISAPEEPIRLELEKLAA
jgi:2-dehydropantoate 2-reductase